MKCSVTAIVPAYNEEKKIRGVLESLVSSSFLDEVICVNDGSTDTTASIAKTIHGVTVINLKKNFGKAYAIGKGLRRAKGEIVLFIDADLNGVSNTALRLLIKPLEQQTHQAVIGYRDNKYEMFWFRPLTGERAYFRQDILPYVKTFKKKGYGLELFLNYLFHDKKVKRVLLPGVRHIWKRKKQPYLTSLKGDYLEVKDLMREVASQEKPLHYFYYAYIHGYYL